MTAAKPATRWVLPTADPEAIAALANALQIGAPTAKVLAHRGFTDAAIARRFLDPAFDELHDPFLLRGMTEAVERIARAISNREPVLIYGDYDVDGTTSVVLLVTAIRLAGGIAQYHVPHRLKDGYGMREDVVEEAAAQGFKLIISVDTGIRAGQVVCRANELGIDVIVTDHHLPETELPPALAVLNPNRSDCSYPEKNLCGAGVAFKVIQALLPRLGWSADKVRRTAESFLKLAAIATVADVVPLTGENRIIVAHGLRGLERVRNPGLRALLDVAGFTGASTPSARQVAFQIAPRLNAAGRMDTAQAVVELFLTTDAAYACDLAQQLHDQNAERQLVQAEIATECERIAVDAADCALVYYSAEWHRGVLGIVASKLVDRLQRPVFVLGRNPDDGLAQGSGRSIPAFHLLEALESMADLFERFGGHAHAAGVTLREANVEEFRRRFRAFAARRLCAEDFLRRVEIDAVVELPEITDDAIEELTRLGPFGHGNPPPLFAAMNAEVAGHPTIWKEKHLKVTVRQRNRNLTLKAWNFAPRVAELAPGTRVDVAFHLEKDAWAAARGLTPYPATLYDFRRFANPD
jgi:single-stranded-DNA-specific exonuclease